MKKNIAFMLIFLGLWIVSMFASYVVRTPDSEYDIKIENELMETVTLEQTWAITEQQGYRSGSFYQCDATSKYVFFSYSKNSCVDAYDLNGEFQFAILLPDYPKGAVSIRCVEEELYISTKRGDVYVFADKSEIERYSDQEARNQGYYGNWFDNKENGLTVNNKYVFRMNSTGGYLFKFETPKLIKVTMPTSLWSTQISNVLGLFLLVLFISALFFVIRKRYRTGDSRTGDGSPS